MKKTLYLITSLLFLFIADTANAQDYKTAVGVKFGGYENGLSVKHFTNENTALEGILGFRRHGVVITGLYEIHQQAFKVERLKFYYGFGAHIGSSGKGYYRRFGADDEFYEESKLLIGLDGVLGLEYKIPDAPVAVSIDLNPRAELARGKFFDLAPGLGIKYTF